MSIISIRNVGYKLVRNATPTADKAPYVGLAIPVGSLATDNILNSMIDGGTFLSNSTCQFCLDEFFEYAAEAIAADIVRINLGTVSIYPMIGGGFDSEDDAYQEPRNSLYVGATLAQGLRDSVAEVEPEFMGDAASDSSVKIWSVMDIATQTFKTIDGLNPFRIAGIDLTVPDGPDESLALYKADGTTKVCDITVTENDGGQQLVCSLSAAAITKGSYVVKLVSHGIDPTAPLATVTHKVTVLAVEAVVSPPEISSIEGEGEGVINVTSPFTITGTNLEGATVSLIYNGETEPFCTVPMTYTDGRLIGNAGYVGTLTTNEGSVKVTNAAGSAQFPVYFENH